MRFDDRRSAGRLLGEAVSELSPVSPVVLALPRGGVPVGFEVAAALGCDLDVLVVRKVGVPMQPELAMGAISEGGVIVRNEEVLGLVRIDPEEFESVVSRERVELERRLRSYRGTVPAIDPAGRVAIIVDDGLATGSTAMAAVSVLRERGSAEVWVAVPVAPHDTAARIGSLADRLIVLHQPRHFGAVGYWYSDFTQTTDQEVERLLARSRLR